MPEELIVYAPDSAPLPLDELFELSGTENIQANVDEAGVWTRCVITWKDVRLHIESLSAAEQQAAMPALSESVEAYLGGRSDSTARKHRRRLELVEQAWRLRVEPDWDAERKAEQIVLGLCAFYDGAFFVGEAALYNATGKRILGPEDARNKYFIVQEDPESEEALARKAGSLNRLRRARIPTIPHLPVIRDSAHVVLRPVEEAARRAMCLYLIAARAEGESLAQFEAGVRRYGLEEAVTADEWAYARESEPIEQDTIKFSQRYESYWTLLWALGFVPQIGWPDTFADVDKARQILASRSAEQFIAQAKLRPVAHLLDELDLVYRMNWAVIDAELYGKGAPADLEQAAVYERHYALNWLTGYLDQEWDRVTTDT